MLSLGAVPVNKKASGDGIAHAVLFENGMMTDLGTLPDGNSASALDINNHGQVVGSSKTDTGTKRAVLWTPP